MKRIICIICLTLIVNLGGCSSVDNNRVIAKPKLNQKLERFRSWAKWMFLASFVKKHFDTGDKTLEEIAADLSLAEYNLELKKRQGLLNH